MKLSGLTTREDMPTASILLPVAKNFVTAALVYIVLWMRTCVQHVVLRHRGNILTT